jgi:transposase
MLATFTAQRDRLATIPGVSKPAAEALIGEIGVDMTRFPTAGHLASWAGMCPGNNDWLSRQAGAHWLSQFSTQSRWPLRGRRDGGKMTGGAARRRRRFLGT